MAPFAALLLLVALVPRPQEEPDPRRVLTPKADPSGDTLNFKAPSQGFVLEHAVVQGSARSALLFYDHRGPHVGTVLRDVKLCVEPGTVRLDRSYWGLRGYDMVDTLLEDVEITGFGRVTPLHDEGHAIYLNLAGDLTLRRSRIHHNGGQALQLVNRPRESDLAPGPMPGSIRILATRIEENGFNPDRGGFQVSIFGTGQDVLLRDVEIVAGLDGTVWPQGLTSGGLVVEPEPYAPERNKLPWWRPAVVPEDFVPPFTQGRAVLERVTVRHRNPGKSLVQIKGCRELVVTGCTFEAVLDEAAPAGTEGKIVLDAPDKPGRDSGRIEWRGNLGDAVVYLRGERLGLACEDFVIGGEEQGESE